MFITFYCCNDGDMVFLWQVLASSGCVNSLSQMPIVLIPVHFDRDQVSRIPSCQRSVVLRPFCSHDFMTGVPAIPGRELPVDVSVTRFFISVMQCTYLYVLLHNVTGSCYIVCAHMEGL
jgi:GMP synthase (glutamine-hydrolysing)